MREECYNSHVSSWGTSTLNTLASMSNLAVVYGRVAAFDKAVPLHEESLQLTRAQLGHDHPLTLTIMNNLAEVYGSVGAIDKALPLAEETLRLHEPSSVMTIPTQFSA